MVIRNYGKFINGYPQYLRLPIQLTADITINGVVHPAGSWLSTDNESAILELGYKPIIRSEMPEKEGYYYIEKWTDTGTAPSATPPRRPRTELSPLLLYPLKRPMTLHQIKMVRII